MATTVVYTRSERFADDKYLRHHGSENKHKRGRQKTVTWPMDEKLCEVRHFLVDDAPSSLGVAVQGFLHCKQRSLPFAHNMPSYKESSNLIGYYPTEAKRTRFTSVTKQNGYLAPDFGFSMAKSSPVPEVELEASMTIAATWHRPYKFVLDDSWLWAGGEESTEVALQQQRERRLFEAFYPRLASVPDSPAEPLESWKQVDDSSLLEIPLIPLEEEETQDVEPEKMTENKNTGNFVPERKEMTDPLKHGTDVLKHGDDILCSNPIAESVKFNQSNMMSEADSNIAAVAAAACMVVKSLGESDLVDEKLLLEILKNPSLLKSLTCSDQFTRRKSQVKNNDTAGRISQEPISSPLCQLPPDHGAYLNASPVSVLARWEEGAIAGSSFGTTPIASGSANIGQPTIEASHKASRTGRDFSQKGFEIATRAVPEIFKTSPFKPTNLQESSLVHACKPKDEVKLSCQNGLRNNVLSASCSLQSVPTVTPSIGPSSSLSTPLSNSELPWRTSLLRDPPLGRSVQDAESKTLQAKKSALGVPTNMGGGGRAKRFCMYFNSPRGCRNGGSCAFVHQLLDSELNTMAL